jgi:hypothetical protein
MEFTNYHIENPEHLNDAFRLEKISQSYRLLKINEKATLRKIRKEFRIQLIALHPYLKAKDIYYRRFINICLAYSLLKRIKEKPLGRKKTQKELFDEWFSFERENALNEALLLAGMSTTEFEECMIVGYRFVLSNITGITILAAVMAIGIPINVYLHDRIDRLHFIYVLFGTSAPLFYLAFAFASNLKFKASKSRKNQIRKFNSLLQ